MKLVLLTIVTVLAASCGASDNSADGDGRVVAASPAPEGSSDVSLGSSAETVPTTSQATDDGVPSSDEPASACVEAIEALRRGLPAYDYESATDLNALIDSVDAVVVGTIEAVRGHDGRIEFLLADAITLGGTEAVDLVQTAGTLFEANSVDALIGVRLIAFVRRLDGGGFVVDVQGLLAQCPGGISRILEPLPADPRLAGLRGIDDLVSYVRQRQMQVERATTELQVVR